MKEEHQSYEKKDKKDFGFRSALYLDLPKIDERLKEISEGVENLKLNSNLITPNLTPRASDPKTFEFLKNCISSDLLRRLEESSPIKSHDSVLHRKISEIISNFENMDERENAFAFALTEKNYKEEKVKSESKCESPEISFDETVLDLKNLKQNTNNYLPKNTAAIKEDYSFKNTKLCGNEKDEEDKRQAIPMNCNFNKIESPRHKVFKYSDSKASPILNYYNDTTEYFSQIFTGNHSNNSNNNSKILIKRASSNEFFKLHLHREEDSTSNNQGSSNNLLHNEQVNGNIFEREKVDVSYFSVNKNENKQDVGKKDLKNFPILSKMPMQATTCDKNINKLDQTNSDSNGLDNGRSPSCVNDDLTNIYNNNSKNYASVFNNLNYENNMNSGKNTENFTKLNYNQPQSNSIKRGFNDQLNIFNEDHLNKQQAYIQNNYEKMNQNGEYAFANNSNKNPLFTNMPIQNINFPMDNYNMNQFNHANNFNQNCIENGDGNGFMHNFNQKHLNNYPNFDMNNEEQRRNQFWQKNFGKKNNANFVNSNLNISYNELFNGNINQNTNYTSKFDPEEYIVEMFDKRGWICEACNNFNYETRMKCNRCKIPKIPKKITNKKNKFNTNKKNFTNIENGNPPNSIDSTNPSRNQNQNFDNLNSNLNRYPTAASYNRSDDSKNIQNRDFNPFAKINDSDADSKLEDLDSSRNSNERKNKRPFMERVGDWVCIKCKNLNFSFRVMCNRCQMTNYESEKLTEQYLINYSNYIKFNEMMQQRILMNHTKNMPNNYTNQAFFMNNANLAGNNFFNGHINNSDLAQGYMETNKANFPRMPIDFDGFNYGHLQNLNYPIEQGFCNNQVDYANQGNFMLENNRKIKVNGQIKNNQTEFIKESKIIAYSTEGNVNINNFDVDDS